MVPVAAHALLALSNGIVDAGGTALWNQVHRSHDDQAGFYKIYQNGGAPAQKPGMSGHQGGISVDNSTVSLAFPAPADQQIDKLWGIAIPLGWRPVIDRPDETKNERWHLDFWAEWEPVRARRGYTEAAICTVLDLGPDGQSDKAWGLAGATARAVQAQLHRAGYDVGAIDGVIGKRTTEALVKCGAGATCRDPAALYALPNSAVVIWS